MQHAEKMCKESVLAKYLQDSGRNRDPSSQCCSAFCQLEETRVAVLDTMVLERLVFQ